MTGEPDGLESMAERVVTTLCHCWRLTLRDGTVEGFTDHDRAIAFDGVIHAPRSGFAATEARAATGLAAGVAEIEGALSDDRLDECDIRAGRYDGARVDTYLVDWAQPEVRRLVRRAFVGRITMSDGRFVAELETPARHLDRPSGRRIRRRCDSELGDARCGADLSGASYNGTGVVVATGPQIVTAEGIEAFDAGWFDGGTLTWTSGLQAGRTVRVVAGGPRDGQTLLRLWLEDGLTPAAGDEFTIVAGCDKLAATCESKFANILNFRGFPYLPGNDAAYAYPAEGEMFDGGALVE